MLEAYTQIKDQVKTLSLVEVAKNKKKNIIWIDCEAPTKEELESLSNLIGIITHDLMVCLDEGERPRVEAGSDFAMVILKAPLFINKSIETTPLGIFIKDNYVVTLRLEDNRVIDSIKSHPKKDLLGRTIPYFVYHLTSKVILSFDETLEKIDMQVDIIECDVLNKVEKNYMEETFAFKKTLIYFRKAIKSNAEVIKSLRLGLAFNLTSKEKELYSDLYQDAKQLEDIEEINRDRLKEILNVHLSTVSNDLNKVMKSFTVIASLVFVPTLISGIYGMNFEYMPELHWKHGYQYALSLMFFSVFFMAWYFKKKDWLKF